MFLHYDNFREWSKACSNNMTSSMRLDFDGDDLVYVYTSDGSPVAYFDQSANRGCISDMLFE